MADAKTGFDWGKALGYIIPGAIAGTGAILSNRAANKQNDILSDRSAQMDELAKQEMQRRDMYSSLVLPSLLQALGRKDPNLLKQVSGGQGMPSMQQVPQVQSQGSSPGFIVPNSSSGGLGSAIRSGSTGALAGGALGSKIGAIGGPIGMALGAGAGVLASQVGKLGADEERNWVDKVQNPFNQQVAQIIDPITQGRNANTLTKDQVLAAQKALEDKIAQYNNAAGQYSGQGKKQAQTITQSYNTLNPIFKSWRDSLSGDLGRLG